MKHGQIKTVFLFISAVGCSEKRGILLFHGVVQPTAHGCSLCFSSQFGCATVSSRLVRSGNIFKRALVARGKLLPVKKKASFLFCPFASNGFAVKQFNPNGDACTVVVFCFKPHNRGTARWVFVSMVVFFLLCASLFRRELHQWIPCKNISRF